MRLSKGRKRDHLLPSYIYAPRGTDKSPGGSTSWGVDRAKSAIADKRTGNCGKDCNIEVNNENLSKLGDVCTTHDCAHRINREVGT